MIQTFKSGASSSKIPRFDLVPRTALVRLAGRFELGLERHKARAWNARSSQAPLDDKEWVIQRAAHAIDHATKLIEKLIGVRPDDGDDDAAAIMWAGACLCEATKNGIPKARADGDRTGTLPADAASNPRPLLRNGERPVRTRNGRLDGRRSVAQIGGKR